MFRKVLLTFVSVVLTLAFQQTMQTESDAHVQELIRTLPKYSWLRIQLQTGMRGDGINKPYMKRMSQADVRRAELELGAQWHAGKPRDTRILERLYFSKYDGPHAQIRDTESLEAIRASGLESLLSELSIQDAEKRHLYVGIEKGIRHPEGQQIYCLVEFFDDPDLDGNGTPPWAPWGYNGAWPLSEAAEVGDADKIASLLKTQKFSKNELNNALIAAVTNYYDNSDVIDMLLEAGADVNARDSHFGATVLMFARSRPIHVPLLIARGADINAKNPQGKTVLKLARNEGHKVTEQLLEQAGAHE